MKRKLTCRPTSNRGCLKHIGFCGVSRGSRWMNLPGGTLSGILWCSELLRPMRNIVASHLPIAAERALERQFVHNKPSEGHFIEHKAAERHYPEFAHRTAFRGGLRNCDLY